MKPERTEASRLRSATVDVVLTCLFIYFAGWVSGSGGVPGWIAAPAAAVLICLEVGMVRARLRGLLRCRARCEEGFRLIARAGVDEAAAQREARP